MYPCGHLAQNTHNKQKMSRRTCGCVYIHVHVCVHTLYMAVTGRKRTLFHSKWATSMSYISRMLY